MRVRVRVRVRVPTAPHAGVGYTRRGGLSLLGHLRAHGAGARRPKAG